MNLETRVRSTVMRTLASAGFQRFGQRRARLVRRLRRQPPAVHYFHQVDDPYSHLAVQKLDELRRAYAIPFVPHLVSKPDAPFLGNAEHFDQWSLRDAVSIADAYGTRFAASNTPDPAAMAATNALLARHLDQPDFASVAYAAGEALWGCQPVGPAVDETAGRRVVEAGNALRRVLGHYQGGMFHFDGEWYWGVDRLRHLEQRLIDEGYAQGAGSICVPEPAPVDTTGLNARHVMLEYFPSLRSPYTAIGHQRVLDLISRSGVTVKLRPVMPMLMRGVPAPRAKQRSIITDAGREGRAHGSPLGRIVDPFGEPVRRAFALFPGALALDRGMEFVTAYLRAAWVNGTDITTEAGLRDVVANAGMDWNELEDACSGTDWEAELDANLQQMLGSGLWGVPSFRVSSGNRNDDAAFACWGQDRIWRVENEIASRA
jgi:2-hydroxychromene-2-carboxylate isomerase